MSHEFALIWRVVVYLSDLPDFTLVLPIFAGADSAAKRPDAGELLR